MSNSAIPLSFDPLQYADTMFRLREIRRFAFGRGEAGVTYNMILDAEGSFYLSHPYDHRLAKYDAGGNLTFSRHDLGSGVGPLRYPSGMALDGEHLLLVDSWNHRILRLDSDGHLDQLIAEVDDSFFSLTAPTDITAGPSGHFLVLDEGNERVLVLDSELKFLSEIRADPNRPLPNPHLFIGHSAEERETYRGFFSRLYFPKHIKGHKDGFALTNDEWLVLFSGLEQVQIHSRVNHPIHQACILGLDQSSGNLFLYEALQQQCLIFNLYSAVFYPAHTWKHPPMGICFHRNQIYALEHHEMVVYQIEGNPITSALDFQTACRSAATTKPSDHQSPLEIDAHLAADCLSKALVLHPSLPHDRIAHLRRWTLSHFWPRHAPLGCKVGPWFEGTSFQAFEGYLITLRDTFRRIISTLSTQTLSPVTQTIFQRLLTLLFETAQNLTSLRLDYLAELCRMETQNRLENSANVDSKIFFLDQLLELIQRLCASFGQLALGQPRLSWPDTTEFPNPEQLQDRQFQLFHHFLAHLHATGAIPTALRQAHPIQTSARRGLQLQKSRLVTFHFQNHLLKQAFQNRTPKGDYNTITTYHVLNYQRLILANGFIHASWPLDQTLKAENYNGRFGYLEQLRSFNRELEGQGTDTVNATAPIQAYFLRTPADHKNTDTALPELNAAALHRIVNREPPHQDSASVSEWLERAAAYDLLGNFDEALKQVKNVPTKMENLDVNLFKIKLYLQLGRTQECAALLEKTILPVIELRKLYTTWIHYVEGNPPQALTELESVSEEQCMSHYLKGLIYRSQGNHRGAIACFEREDLQFPTWHNLFQRYLSQMAAKEDGEIRDLDDPLLREVFILWNGEKVTSKDPHFPIIADAMLTAERTRKGADHFGQTLRQYLLPMNNTRLPTFNAPVAFD